MNYVYLLNLYKKKNKELNQCLLLYKRVYVYQDKLDYYYVSYSKYDS